MSASKSAPTFAKNDSSRPYILAPEPKRFFRKRSLDGKPHLGFAWCNFRFYPSYSEFYRGVELARFVACALEEALAPNPLLLKSLRGRCRAVHGQYPKYRAQLHEGQHAIFGESPAKAG